jgi:hypothetical protein
LKGFPQGRTIYSAPAALPQRVLTSSTLNTTLEAKMKAHRFALNHPIPTPHRRWLVGATALVAAVTAAPSASASSATKESSPRACFWEPAAGVLPFDPQLVGTVRMVGSEVEILHRVQCTDDTERWMWMPASYDGCQSQTAARRSAGSDG